MKKREIKKIITKSLNNFPITLITGARQVGKSTLCYEISKELEFSYISLDDISIREMAVKDPKFFLSKYKAPIIIDEIQYAPVLFEVLQSIVNNARLTSDKSNGMYILTGSQSFHLMKGVTQSLAGRVNIIEMKTFSYGEIFDYESVPFSFNVSSYFDETEKTKKDNIFKVITRGFYPELYKNEHMNASDFYSSYISTYIDKDVTELINIKDKFKFHNFMQYLASMTSQELKYGNICKSLGLDLKTVKAWISVLESSDIIHLVQPYNETSITKRIVKSPKIYFWDTGLACHLAKFNDYKTLENSYFAGAFYETFVVNELLKNFINNKRNLNVNYYRDNNQNEIDLVLIENATHHCIEIKLGIKYTKSDIKSFKQLNESKYNKGTSYVICSTDVIYKIDDDVYAIPFYYI